MEITKINRLINTICIQADTFPEGIQDAYKRLEILVPDSSRRQHYGISYGDNGGRIIYKAAAEELHEGEAQQLGAESFTIEKGIYLTVTIKDWMKDIPSIGKTFDELLKDSRVDKNGYCIEKYINDRDMLCMVKLKQEEK